MSDDDWGKDHHLVGSTLTKTILRQSENGKHYTWTPETSTIEAFQPELPMHRKPALWRSYVANSTEVNKNGAAVAAEGDANASANDVVSADVDERKPAAMAGGTLKLALDHVSTDWQTTEKNPADLHHIQQVASERLQHTLWCTILQDYMPHLIMTAALEEVQAQYLRQRRRHVESTNGSATSKANNNMQLPPRYYHQNPNSYLVPPTRETDTDVRPSITFSPSQLVPRIKQGCRMLYDWHGDKTTGVGGGAGGARTSNPFHLKRSSSRLARQVVVEQAVEPTPLQADPSGLVNVQPGGKVALFLSTVLVGNRSEKQSEGMSLENEEDREAGVLDSGDDPEDETPCTDNNPYLIASEEAIIEWLGRKTAKLLTIAELQGLFPQLSVQATIGSKNKRKLVALDRLGIPLDEIATPIDLDVLRDIDRIPNGGNLRLVLQMVTDHGDVLIEEMDTGYFGRSLFAVKLVDGVADDEDKLVDAEGFAEKMQKYKEEKGWQSLRHKGIQSGYSTWPSWTTAVSLWLNKLKAETQPTNNLVTPPEGEYGASAQIVIALAPLPPETGDVELAQAIAEEEGLAISKERRRTTRRADGATFYGTQANMTQRQLMDAILRLVSQRGFQSMIDLVDSVPGESRDPFRRMRTSLGRLAWKRNQLSVLPVRASLTDLIPWKKLQAGPIRRVSSAAIVSGTMVAEVDVAALSALVAYIRSLHTTEIQLRRLVLRHFSEMPIIVVATAADERAGTLESMDDADFEDPSTVEWRTSGHHLLGKSIFRPPDTHDGDETKVCLWFRIVDYSPSVESTTDDAPPATERSFIGSAKESDTVERRNRFRAEEISSDGASKVHGATRIIYLTEAQVRAGMVSADMETKRINQTSALGHPYGGGGVAKVTMFSPDSPSHAEMHGVVVGYNSRARDDGKIVHKVLIMLDDSDEAVWATLDTLGSVLACTVEGDHAIYHIRQFDYHSTSPAFQECRSVLASLQKHPKAFPFYEPVDPVTLQIPTYFSVVKKPMDISTVAKKLESGQYSVIPQSHNADRSPVARMLNGPFRRDVERIFDNAMLFNPPNDWIYQAASSIKKIVQKKIDQISDAADEEMYGRSHKQNVYVDEDSDVDLYVDESDADDGFTGERRARKRTQAARGPAKKDDASSFAIERAHRLQKILGDPSGLRGVLAFMSMRTDPNTFSIPNKWRCRRCTELNKKDADYSLEHDTSQLNELMALQGQLEENENASLRRSTRADLNDTPSNATIYRNPAKNLQFLIDDISAVDNNRLITTRREAELEREHLHEERYARLYLQHRYVLESESLNEGEGFGGLGKFADDSFPPYLGCVVPESSPSSDIEGCWEIRQPYVIPALRWVIRGLIQSNHLCEIEPLLPDSPQSGVVMANNSYYLDPSSEPFEILDQREIQRRKQRNLQEQEESEDDAEVSEYEKLRAERVARNADRLKALGLA